MRRLLVSHRGYTDTHDLMPTFTLMSKHEFVGSADLCLFSAVGVCKLELQKDASKRGKIEKVSTFSAQKTP